MCVRESVVKKLEFLGIQMYTMYDVPFGRRRCVHALQKFLIIGREREEEAR